MVNNAMLYNVEGSQIYDDALYFKVAHAYPLIAITCVRVRASACLSLALD